MDDLEISLRLLLAKGRKERKREREKERKKERKKEEKH